VVPPRHTDDAESAELFQERRRLPEMLSRLARLESDVCKYDTKFSDLVSSVNAVSLSLHELATRIDTGIKTILIGFGLITTLSGAFWAYQNKTDEQHEKIMRNTQEQVEHNTKELRHD